MTKRTGRVCTFHVTEVRAVHVDMDREGFTSVEKARQFAEGSLPTMEGMFDVSAVLVSDETPTQVKAKRGLGSY